MLFENSVTELQEIIFVVSDLKKDIQTLHVNYNILDNDPRNEFVGKHNVFH